MNEALMVLGDALADAWRSGATISFPPARRPCSRSEAYAVQDRMADRLDDAVFGWKVGAGAPAVQRMEGHDGPIPGRLFASRSFATPATVAANLFPRAKVECEIAARLTRAVGYRAQPYSREELEGYMELHPAIEITGTRYRPGGVLTTYDVIADNGNGAGFVYGPALALGDGFDIHALSIIASIDGGPTIGAYSGELLRDPVDVAVETVNSVVARGHAIAEGCFISTGSLTVPTQIGAGQTLAADFGRRGQLRLHLSDVDA